MNKIVLAFITLCASISLYADKGTLRYITDGDTVKFDNTICRLANIDTPESKKNDRLKRIASNCGVKDARIINAGKEAKKNLKKYLEVGRVYNYTVTDTDKYNRKVCLINISNTETVNIKMVEDGYAYPYFKYIPKQLVDKYKKALKSAEDNERGLFKKQKDVMNCLKEEV